MFTTIFLFTKKFLFHTEEVLNALYEFFHDTKYKQTKSNKRMTMWRSPMVYSYLLIHATCDDDTTLLQHNKAHSHVGTRELKN